MLIQDNYKKVRANYAIRQRKTSENNRIVFVLFLLFTALFLLCAYLFYFQVTGSDEWETRSNKIYYRSVPVFAERGKILDRNGVILAMNEPRRNIIIDPYKLPNFSADKLRYQNKPRLLAKVAQQENEFQKNLTVLAVVLGKPRAEVVRLFDYRSYLNKPRGDRYLQKKVDLATANRIRKMNLPGVKITPVNERRYPDGNLFGQVIGVTKLDVDADKNERIIGLEGIEYQFDPILRGKNGLKVLIQDNNGRYIDDVQSAKNVPAHDGRDLVLALDKNIQSATMDVLRETVTAHQADSGSAVVLDAKTGEVLAMVNYPDFDPANFTRYAPQVRRNYAVNDLIEPGSTFKPFIIAKALDAGKVKPNTVFNTNPYMLGNHLITDVGRYPSLTVTGIIQKSSNIGVSRVAALLNSEDLYRYLVSIGIGRKPQSGFPGEAGGVLRSWEKWTPLDKASLSYGYGTQLSLLQLARAYTMFTNDGELLTPSFLKLTEAPKAVRIIAPETAKKMREIMLTVTEPGGSGTKAAIPGFKVAGKSGTARKVINGRYSNTNHIAFFAGFAPADAPRLIVVVSINNPRAGGYYGGAIAAPAFAKIMADALGILGVTPAPPAAMPETARLLVNQGAAK